MRLICHEGLTEVFLLTLREPITRGAQKKPDLIEGITLAPAVTGRVLLDAATHLIESIASELDNMEGIEDAGGVLELIVDGVLSVPGRDPPSRSGYRSELFAALGQPVLMHGARPTRDQVHSSGPWDDPHLEWSTMPVSSRGPVDVGPGDATHLSSTPSTRTPAKRAGSSDAARRHGLIWDHTVFHVVRHIQRRLNHRNLARTPAQGASITSTTTRPWP